MEDRQELKIRALVERIASLVASYESQLADLRVEYTISDSQLRDAREQFSALENRITELENDEVDSEDF